MTYWDAQTGEEISDETMHERFDNMLDEVHERVTVGEASWNPSVVLKELDPIAYRVAFCEYVDTETNESIVDEGWWVRVLTEDGEIETEPEWFTDVNDAYHAHENIDREDHDFSHGPLTFQLYAADGSMLNELRLS